MLLEHERDYGLGMDALVTVCSWNTNDGSGMDALVTVCSWNTSELWASARGALALGAGGAKLLASPNPFKKFRPLTLNLKTQTLNPRLWGSDKAVPACSALTPRARHRLRIYFLSLL